MPFCTYFATQKRLGIILLIRRGILVVKKKQKGSRINQNIAAIFPLSRAFLKADWFAGKTLQTTVL